MDNLRVNSGYRIVKRSVEQLHRKQKHIENER